MTDEKILLEIKYLGRGKKADVIGSIFVIFAGIMIPGVLLPSIGINHIIEGGWDWHLMEIFIFVLFPILVILFGLRLWPIWPRFIRFSSNSLTFIDSDIGPVTRKIPYEVKWNDILRIEGEFDNKLLLVYSKELKDEQISHKDIDLSGLTAAQMLKVINTLKEKGISIEKSSRITFSQLIEMMDNAKKNQ